jgi:hypothetical protein
VKYLMRRTILILSTLLVTLFFMACGERSTTVTNANANAGGSTMGASGNSGTTGGTTGETAGSGPQNQGIGGTGEGNTNAVNGNTYTVPPGFNKNGDRGSASNVSKTP